MLTVEEYLRTSFEDGDCDYVDGQVVERNIGEVLHSSTQAQMCFLIHRPTLAALLSIRLRINPTRYRVADVAVWRNGDELGPDIPRLSPFLVVEILSPKDKIGRIVPKINDYFDAGVEYVWAVDPYERIGLMFSRQDRLGESVDVLRTEDPAIEIPLETVLNPQD